MIVKELIKLLQTRQGDMKVVAQRYSDVADLAPPEAITVIPHYGNDYYERHFPEVDPPEETEMVLYLSST